MTDVLVAWGPEVTLGFVGCYLIVCAIVGKLIRIKYLFSGVQLRSSAQRVLLGCFGLILAGPVIWSTYGHLVFGTKGVLVPPNIEETVVAPAKSSRLTALLHLNVSWSQASGQGCPLLESFGLEQRNIRQLKSAVFHRQVYAYVPDFRSVPRKPFKVWVVVAGNGSWPSSGKLNEEPFKQKLAGLPPQNIFSAEVRQKGQPVAFRYGGQLYRLTVTQIYAVLFGSDKIAVEVCGPTGETGS